MAVDSEVRHLCDMPGLCRLLALSSDQVSNTLPTIVPLRTVCVPTLSSASVKYEKRQFVCCRWNQQRILITAQNCGGDSGRNRLQVSGLCTACQKTSPCNVIATRADVTVVTWCVTMCNATVVEWSTDDVCVWLDKLGLTEYRNTFTTNDIRGQELVSLSRLDLKVSGRSEIMIARNF